MLESTHKVWISCQPGLSRILREELRGLLAATSSSTSAQAPRIPSRIAIKRTKGENDVPVERGLLATRVSTGGLLKLFHFSRVAERIRVAVGPEFGCHGFRDLARSIDQLPLSSFAPRGSSPTVKVSLFQSKIFHTTAAQQRAQHYVKQRLAQRSSTSSHQTVSEPRPPVIPCFQIDVEKNVGQISATLDQAEGKPLFRRSWKTHVAGESLRETFAAACCYAAGIGFGSRIRNVLENNSQVSVRPLSQMLWDPFCGTGTIPIEAAALLARPATSVSSSQSEQPSCSTPPVRSLALPEEIDLPGYSYQGFKIIPPDLYHSFCEHAFSHDHREDNRPSQESPTIFCSDISTRLAKQAKENYNNAVGAARQSNWILPNMSFMSGDFEAVEPHIPANCSILTNLPYGVRTGELKPRSDPQSQPELAARTKSELFDIYARFGKMLSRRPDLQNVHVLVAKGCNFAKYSGHEWDTVLEFSNNGLNVKLLRLQ